MKAVTFGALTACVGAVAVIAACGGSSPAPSGGGANNFASTGSGGGQNLGGACATMCQSDNDCSACGNAPAGSSYCCDVGAGVCALLGGNSCPAVKSSSGDGVSNPGSGNGNNGGSSAGSGGGSTSGSGSPMTCMQDSDCSGMPAMNGGINCCDTTMGMCFTSTASTCPAPDAGTMGD